MPFVHMSGWFILSVVCYLEVMLYCYGLGSVLHFTCMGLTIIGTAAVTASTTGAKDRQYRLLCLFAVVMMSLAVVVRLGQ